MNDNPHVHTYQLSLSIAHLEIYTYGMTIRAEDVFGGSGIPPNSLKYCIALYLKKERQGTARGREV